MPPTNSSVLNWQWLPFAQLGSCVLYQVLQLRSAVFVVEQACVFQDMDGLDAQAMHLLGWLGEPGGRQNNGQANNAPATNVQNANAQLLAYARCFPAGVTYPEASLGRVATHPRVRGAGAGHALVAQALARLQAQWGAQSVRIGAQAHLQGFYAQHGFVATDDGYMEDGIAHVQMLRNVP